MSGAGERSGSLIAISSKNVRASHEVAERRLRVAEAQLELAQRDHRPRLVEAHAVLLGQLARLGGMGAAFFLATLERVEPCQARDRAGKPRELRRLARHRLRFLVLGARERPAIGGGGVAAEHEEDHRQAPRSAHARAPGQSARSSSSRPTSASRRNRPAMPGAHQQQRIDAFGRHRVEQRPRSRAGGWDRPSPGRRGSRARRRRHARRRPAPVDRPVAAGRAPLRAAPSIFGGVPGAERRQRRVGEHADRLQPIDRLDRLSRRDQHRGSPRSPRLGAWRCGRRGCRCRPAAAAPVASLRAAASSSTACSACPASHAFSAALDTAARPRSSPVFRQARRLRQRARRRPRSRCSRERAGQRPPAPSPPPRPSPSRPRRGARHGDRHPPDPVITPASALWAARRSAGDAAW